IFFACPAVAERRYVFGGVAAAILAAVEPGILPGGSNSRMPKSAGLFADRRTTWCSFEGQDGAYLLSAPLNVAQVSNMLYRRFPIGRASPVPRLCRRRSVCGLENLDTAGRKSALPRAVAGCT